MASHIGTTARSGALVAAIVVAAACGSDPPPPTAASSTTTDVVALIEVGPGDCFNGLTTVTNARATAEVVTRVPCDQPHDHEVFHAFAYGDDERFPGIDVLVGLAESGCRDAFVGNVGNPDALDQVSIWPTSKSWAEGDRTVLCAAFARDGDQLVGSIR